MKHFWAVLPPSLSDGIFFLDFHRFVSELSHLKVTLKWLWTDDASEFFVAGDAAGAQFVRAHVEHWCKHGEGGTLCNTISWCSD